MKALTASWFGLAIGLCAWSTLLPTSAQGPNDKSEPRQRVQVAVADPLAFPDRTGLRAGDSLTLHVFFVPKRVADDFKGQYVVSDQGFVSIPFVGPIQA
ncbi:MAG TPA: polysaccharide biosynthesis/export family protein, partial [Chthoniobacteraceae bacterium]|nr:polysaccharide biosynthesis/export family protein [Chthoniobacteraceae bacterium]